MLARPKTDGESIGQSHIMRVDLWRMICHAIEAIHARQNALDKRIAALESIKGAALYADNQSHREATEIVTALVAKVDKQE